MPDYDNTQHYRILDEEFEPVISENGQFMLRFRYLKQNADDSYERPVHLFRRVAWNLAEAEKVYDPHLSHSKLMNYAEKFFNLMTEFKYLPNAPTLLGAGRPLQQLHACIVLPVGDSIEEIFEAIRFAAVVHSKGGGTGFSFSHLRSRGVPIMTGGVSTGPISFLRLFDAETEVIKKGGTGWGANMGVLRYDHPDILEFIIAKSSGNCLKNFNLSVGITDEFMDLYERGEMLPLIDPHTREIVRRIPARDLFDLICKEAWKTGEPGLIFLDRLNQANPTPALGSLECTNPCGEAPLLPFEACCLGGLNVSKFLDPVTRDLQWDELREAAALALRMMDNVVEACKYPLPQIESAARRTRKVGIGVMGFADLLIELGIPYGSSEAEGFARELMRNIQDATRDASAQLASERGNFPAFQMSTWSQQGWKRLRNATTTSNAPNSTISAIAGCSAGIEPLFAIGYYKALENGAQLTEIHPKFIQLAKEYRFYSEKLLNEVCHAGTLQNIVAVPAEVARIFQTAHDIDPTWHIRIQSAFQQYTDLAVSKTINLPNHATTEDISGAFRLAFKLRCKGVTCYRDKCQERQFLTVSEADPVTTQECKVCQ